MLIKSVKISTVCLHAVFPVTIRQRENGLSLEIEKLSQAWLAASLIFGVSVCYCRRVESTLCVEAGIRPLCALSGFLSAF